MTSFTVVIIIWVIYQLVLSLLKKDNRKPAGKSPDPPKSPDGRSIREVWQEASRGSWREQMQQALKEASRQAEEWTAYAEPSKADEAGNRPKDPMQTEGIIGSGGIQGTGITQGSKGTSAGEEMPGIGAGIGTSSVDTMPRSAQVPGTPSFSLRDTELVQGVIWSEILGKPRALRPFRGPRS